MTQAICFECFMSLDLGKTLEELIEDRFPVFCSIECSNNFPDNGTDLFEKRLSELRGKQQTI